MRAAWLARWFVMLCAACGGSSSPATPDAGRPDAGRPDAASPDAGDGVDASIPEASIVELIAGNIGGRGSAGNLYVTDTGNNTVRKISPAGAVTTLAGSAGPSGHSDGAGAAARFNNPTGVVADGAGNVYIADNINDTIRKITPAGVVTTFAGVSLTGGSSDGTGSAARFNEPTGIAIDAAGNLYVAEESNFTIRKITPAGVVTTLAGTPGKSGSVDATGPAARFGFPEGIAVDSAGNLYVADTGNSTIRKNERRS